MLARDEAVTVPVALAGMITFFQGNLYGQASALTMVSLIPRSCSASSSSGTSCAGLTLGAVQG